jgi:hypothetical protein
MFAMMCCQLERPAEKENFAFYLMMMPQALFDHGYGWFAAVNSSACGVAETANRRP